ncbi:N-acetylmuramoyl-L-alanine amidase [Geomicrobium sp. JCM 19037]|uniref:SH3 domain-containing protein n=1 Tax=Geomicrobium sp. JCM 19037 TaxID=1460634 RepID=UPI00045F142B|nr:SH3 domain-containing protein [Geomicrobium sp. JCM 19037]GAK02576.1 N-acetylmuramoyl-L-alanine amidase [Geomicrobium sp. JCM 19037]
MRHKASILALLAVFVCASWFTDIHGGVFGEASIAEAAVEEVPFEGTVVVSSTLNVRSGPGTSNAAIGQLRNGQVVTVIDIHEEGTWYEIEYQSSTGYVHSSYIVQANNEPEDEDIDEEQDEEIEEREVIDRAIVDHHALAVRASASGTSERVGTLYEGNEINIYDYEEGSSWVLIQFDGQFAYTHLDHLRIIDEDEDTEPEQPAEDTLEVIERAVVNHHTLAVRASASGSSERVGSLQEGDQIEIYEYVNGGPWVKFDFNGTVAYTSADYLNILPPLSDGDYEVIEQAVVNHHTLAVRDAASGSANRVGSLTEGDRVDIYEYVNGGPWVKFNFNGVVAYTSADYLRTVTNDPNPTPPEEEEELGEKIATGVVDASTRLAVREQPNGSSNIIVKLSNGTMVDIYEYVNGGPWVKITYDGEVAYTHSDYLNVINAGEVIDTGTVTFDGLVVRDRPSGSSTNIGRLARGTQVDIYNFVNGGPWVEIRYNGGTGYTHMDHLNLASSGTGPLAGRTIVVDAGHGGRDSGAVGNGLVEKTINLQVSREYAQRLENGGANVIMTRTNDTFIELIDRARIANRANADLFVSVHANAFNSSARGAETFYHPNDGADSRRLATVMQNRLVRDTGMHHRRVDSANFSVLRNTNMTATLVELGFLTNSGDAAIMRQPGYPARAGEALYQGTLDFYR